MNTTTNQDYRPTEAKYKGRAKDMYVTYDLPQQTRGGGKALYPKVQRVYIAGQVKDWDVGTFAKRTGREVHGVKIDYEQSREAYKRKGYTANRKGARYQVGSAKVGRSVSLFSKIAEVPERARNVRFRKGTLPLKYQNALQNVR